MNHEHYNPAPDTMRARRIGVDTYQEPVVYMRRDCPVCRSEGFAAQARVELACGERRIVATLNIVDGVWLSDGDAGLSEAAWAALQVSEGAPLRVSHAPTLDSLSHVRAKVYGHRLDAGAYVFTGY